MNKKINNSSAVGFLTYLLCNGLNKYETILDFTDVCYFILDDLGRILSLNSSTCDILGIKKTDIVNKPLSRYIAPESQFIFSELKQEALSGNTIQSQVKILKKSGALFYVDIKITLIETFDKNKLLVILSNPDRYKRENNTLNKIHESNDTCLVNELISIVTNELNHPLSIISNYICGCNLRLKNKNCNLHEIISVINKIESQIGRISQIILRMNNFISKGKLDCQVTDLDPMIEEVIKLINSELENSIAIHYKKHVDIHKIVVDKFSIQQVILNLMRNSIESIQDGNVESPRISIEINYNSKEKIEISIIDNGPGFAEKNIQRLFDINYTTKPYGLGCSLAFSRAIIESHGGTLLADTALPYGACFKFTLPCISEH